MHLFPAETMSITNSENLEGSEEVLFDLESGRMSVIVSNRRKNNTYPHTNSYRQGKDLFPVAL